MSESAATWHRLDLRMLLVHPVNELGRFAFPLIAVVFFGGGGRVQWWQALVVLAPVVLGVWRYFATTYRITGEHVELREGLLGRSVTRARLDKVRTVTLEASPVHRILQLSKVTIGTGDDQKLELNALATAPARALRADLLRRAPAQHSTTSDAEAAPAPAPAEDETLLRFRPSWLGYAPFTGTGLAIAGAAIGALAGPFQDTAGRVLRDHVGDVESMPIVELIAGGALLVGVILVVLSIAGYALTNWGFHFSRDLRGQSWHVRKGLLSTTESSLDITRVRGLEIARGPGLRLVRAATLKALVVGGDKDTRTNAQLAPATSYADVAGLARRITEDHAALEAPLVEHGPVARRRQLNEGALVLAGLMVLVAVAARATGISWWWVLTPLALTPVLVAVQLDHYRGLGHLLTPQHLVVGQPSTTRRRQLLLRTGIISWTFDQSFFQRRRGIVTLSAKTAAGSKSYDVHDVAEPTAVALADEAVPDLVRQFLA